MRILLVEDDLVLVDVLTKSLTAQNYIVDSVSDGSRAWDYLTHIDYDLIVLDVLLPHLDGVSLCRRIRAEQDETPIVIVTAQHDSRARVRGLDAGADDYVVKPFDIEELMARIRALIRRSGRDLSPILQLGQLVFDPVDCAASYAGIPLTLSAKEYALLDLFFHEPQHVFSIPELLDSLWSSEEYPAEATVRSHIRRLRNKLIDAGAPPDLISNVHGRGYFLNANGEVGHDDNPAAPIDEQQLKHPTLAGSALQEQYQTFLEETWVQFQPKGLQDFQQLEQLLASSPAAQASFPTLETAQMLAHRLKGTLGLFQFNAAVEAAELIESRVESLIQQVQGHANVILPPDAFSHQLQILRETLSLSQPFGESNVTRSESKIPMLWLISDDEVFAHAMATAAEPLPLTLVIFPNLSAARDWVTHQKHQPMADGILISLETQQTQRALSTHLESSTGKPSPWKGLNDLMQFYSGAQKPTLIAIANAIDFETRLQAIRRGVGYLLHRQQPAPQLLRTSLDLLLTPQSSTQTATQAHTRTLIVDDDEYWLKTMTRQLQTHGFRVDTLSDSRQFWTTLEATQPDILILDMKMPKVSGLELCQVIRSDQTWQALPIIFVSALTDQHAQTSAFDVGADDYLCKPIQGKELAHRMMTRLKRHHALLQPENL